MLTRQLIHEEEYKTQGLHLVDLEWAYNGMNPPKVHESKRVV